MIGPQIQHLIQSLSRLPGLGPRSGRRIALHLIKNKNNLFSTLVSTMTEALNAITICTICGNFDTVNPCSLCKELHRDANVLCIVQDVADLWALERTGVYKGLYHVLGGALSALDGVTPEDLNLPHLMQRIKQQEVKEVILALNSTVEGQTTAHYIRDLLQDSRVIISALAQGVPLGGELDYLDEGTLTTALLSRRSTS
jgi:recombination protein RecR